MGAAWSGREEEEASEAEEHSEDGEDEDASSEASEPGPSPMCGVFGGRPSVRRHPSVQDSLEARKRDLGGFVTSTDMKAGHPMPGSHGVLQRRAKAPDNTDKNIEDYIDIDRAKVLGEGGFAKVVIGRNRRTGVMRAVKSILKKRVPDEARMRLELEIMLTMDHPNIVKLFQTFEDQDRVHLVLQICEGGELFDAIVRQGHLAERDAAYIANQIFHGVHYMHVNGVCHRDLKPENYLFQEKNASISNNTLKLIDFGIATRFKEGKKLYTKTGTPSYVAPEILNNWFGYGPECDLWSCGVILFVLLSGTLPFKGRNEKQTLSLVKQGKFAFKAETWRNVSGAAKDLIKGLLDTDASKRMTAEDALDDPWVSDLSSDRQTNFVTKSYIDELRSFQSKSRFHKVARQTVARQLNEPRIAELSRVFMKLDSDGNGSLSYQELSDVFVEAGLVDSRELEDLVRAADASGEGLIDYTEFLAATLGQRQFAEESACLAAFRVFDADDDGYITVEELEKALNDPDVRNLSGPGTVQEILEEVDLNHDGKIDFQEFLSMMRRG